MATTDIQWTWTFDEAGNVVSRGKTWNPMHGCTRVSPGCLHCYAFDFHDRRMYGPWKRGQNPTAPVVYQQPFSVVQTRPEALVEPFSWRAPQRVFVNSMSDVFHEKIGFSYIARVWAAMALTPRHTYIILTKRPERMRAFLRWGPLYEVVLDWADRFREQLPKHRLGDIAISDPARFPLENVWLGTSVEDQEWADQRIPVLIDTPAAVRLLSCEPLLGPVDLSTWLEPRWDSEMKTRRGETYPIARYRTPLHWVIAGGESGRKHRPFDPDWARSLRDQCVAAGTAFFFKQHGGVTSKAGGRLLDGREWSEFPVAPRRAVA